MIATRLPTHRRRVPRSRERGVVLFIALIAMVMLSLAGVALLRSTDSGTSIAGNLASKQSTIAPVNYAIEQAVAALFEGGVGGTGSIVDSENHDAGNNYFANIQPGESLSGVPAVLYGATPSAYPPGFQTYTDPSTPPRYEVRWTIERLCRSPYVGPAVSEAGKRYCDSIPPKLGRGGTAMEESNEDKVKNVPLYRVTIRVDGPPGSNTVTYAQAMLRG